MLTRQSTNRFVDKFTRMSESVE